MISSELLQAMATADGNEGVKRKKITHKHTHPKKQTNNKQTKRPKKQPQKKNQIWPTCNFTRAAHFFFFFLYITLQFAVIARQVDDVKIPIFNS